MIDKSINYVASLTGERAMKRLIVNKNNIHHVKPTHRETVQVVGIEA